MKTIYESESTPKKDGFYMPGEYEEQERTWILWPHRSDVWRCGAKPAQKVFTEIIKTVARFNPSPLVSMPRISLRCARFSMALRTCA